MPNIGAPEFLIILLVVLLIFGSAKLPQLARSLGKSARILKAETKGLRQDAAAEDSRERAARLREEAARLEREAAHDQAPQPRRQGELPSGDPIQGVPVSDYNARKTS
jgi:sec-independent protein translocase protein TatA